MSMTVADVRAMLGYPAVAPEPQPFVAPDERTQYEARIAELEAEVQRLQGELDKSMTPTVPFEGYDDLTIPQIKERIATLTDEERTSVRTYEAANQKRKGVLEALD